MDRSLTPAPTTGAAGFLSGPLGLRLDEEFLRITALSASPEVLDELVLNGQTAEAPGGRLLRLWPDTIWAIGVHPDGNFREVDLSHGQTHLRLRGVEALHFIDLYTYADLFAVPVRAAKAMRTRLNHFDIVIWWTNTRDVHVVAERSLAQSFCDHLNALALRHNPPDPSLTPRPVAPDAPERRG